jgi:type IV pilus assembly protein PilC
VPLPAVTPEEIEEALEQAAVEPEKAVPRESEEDLTDVLSFLKPISKKEAERTKKQQEATSILYREISVLPKHWKEDLKGFLRSFKEYLSLPRGGLRPSMRAGRGLPPQLGRLVSASKETPTGVRKEAPPEEEIEGGDMLFAPGKMVHEKEKVTPAKGEPRKETAGEDGLPPKRGRFLEKRKRVEEVAEMPELLEEKEGKESKEEKEEKESKEEKPERVAMLEPEVPAKSITLTHRRGGGLASFLVAINQIGLGRQRNLFVQNLATMLSAGLSLVDALKTLQLEMRSRAMRNMVHRITDAVENGSALWRAMEDQRVFSPHAIALIRIGEEGGNLAENMQYLAEQQEKDQGLRQKVKMAMIYPSIVITLMIIIVVGLGLFVLPNLIQVLYSLNVELPLITRMLIWFTNAFTTHAPVGIPVFFVGFLIFIVLAKFTQLRIVTQWVLFHIPGVGRLAKEATIARFGVILGGLLKAGVPLVESIHSLAEVTPIASYRRLYTNLLEHINVGDSFSKSFAAIRGSTRLLPISVQQLIATGERSGSLSAVMLKVADIYEKKANETAQKLPIILEPMILLVIGGLVATIAFAIIIPIYSIVGSVGRSG